MELVEILKQETKSLKTQYIEQTVEWAGKEFDRIEPMMEWNEVKWCDFLGLEPRLVNVGTSGEFLSFPKGFHNTAMSREWRKGREKSSMARRIGKGEYLKKAQEKAVSHYEASIQKLAFRIEKKGLDQGRLEVVTSHVGQNIETTLTDGSKTVRAFTILAWGEINRPHYRYLVK